MTEQEKPRPALCYGERTHEEFVRAAARIVIDAALRLIEADPHPFGKRPCQTCASVSALVGRPFGCLRLSQLEGSK